MRDESGLRGRSASLTAAFDFGFASALAAPFASTRTAPGTTTGILSGLRLFLELLLHGLQRLGWRLSSLNRNIHRFHARRTYMLAGAFIQPDLPRGSAKQRLDLLWG